MMDAVNKAKDKAAFEILNGNFNRRMAFLNKEEFESADAKTIAIERAVEWRERRINERKKIAEQGMAKMMPPSADLKALIATKK